MVQVFGFLSSIFLATVLMMVPIGGRAATSQTVPKLPKLRSYIPCPKTPPEVVDYNYNPTYVTGLIEHIPMVSPDSARIMSAMFNPNATFDEFRQLGCYRFFVSTTPFTVNSAYGLNSRVNMTCPMLNLPKWINTCTFEEPYQDFNYVAWIVATDNKDWGLAVRCWNNQYYTWNSWSTLPVLSTKVKKQILDKVESLGFQREFTTIDYTHCCNCF